MAAAAGQASTGLTGMHIPMGVGIAGRVFADGEPVAVDDVADDENSLGRSPRPLVMCQPGSWRHH